MSLWRMITSRESIITAIILLACVAAEMAVLSAFGVSGTSGKPTQDEITYDRLATNLLEHRRFSMMSEAPLEPAVSRSPGYPLFLAFIYWIGGRSVVPIMVVQFVLLAATGWVLFLLAQHYVSVMSAAIAGMLCVVYPQLMFMATFRLTEILSTFLAALAMLAIVRCVSVTQRQTIIALITGGILGVAALVRPSFILVIGFALAALAWQFRRKGIKQAAMPMILMVIGFSVFVAPWVIRNYFVTGKLVPLSVDSGFVLYVSAQQYTGEVNNQLTGSDWKKILDENNARRQVLKSVAPPAEIPPTVYQEMKMNQDYRAEAFQKIQSQSVFQLLLRTPGRVIAFWSVGDSLLRKFHKLTYIFFAIITILTVAGIVMCRKALSKQWVLWIFPVYLTLLHLVFHIETRYSFPARPFLLIYAGVAITGLADSLRIHKIQKNLPED
ncbi:MAG: glycosyltransferase family 39 protein [Anaerolineae bacterium]|nr:glycosyltransferase family 39 protein [Anaerolineae bacterium]